MTESSKSQARRVGEGFYTKYMDGKTVIDVGCGTDPVVPWARRWDMADGDAQTLGSIEDSSVDTSYSSHCLEHMRDPHEALFNWWRIIKPGGHLIFAVPEETLYEQGIVPSIFNPDHKHTFAISTDHSWSPRSINVVDLLARLPGHKVIYLRTIDTNYDYELAKTSGVGTPVDQTLGNAEAAIEVVVQKTPLQPALRSALRQLLVCPTCSRQDLTLNGITMSNKLDLRCSSCGTVGIL
jgi:SAM-dependent methyltransferase